jgi:hypothetical protein
MSSILYDIIRTEREDVEKARVEGLMSGVQGWDLGRQGRKSWEKGGRRKMEKESQNPHAKAASRRTVRDAKDAYEAP